MKINSSKIARLISSGLETYRREVKMEEVGRVLMAGDGIAKISGLPGAMSGEMLLFPYDIYGVALNLDRGEIGAVILGDSTRIQEGDEVRCTGRILEVPVGEALLGRIVDPLGRPMDSKGPIKIKNFRPVEFLAPGVVDRQPVNEPLHTGIKAIDSMTPIGRGQRELIIGDRTTGKSAILLDIILNQKNTGVYCIYVVIGLKTSIVMRFLNKLEEEGAMEYTTIVYAPAHFPASLQYIAPFAGCAIGEYFMFGGKHALILYNDLSKHAVSYRELSLLLRRPPGREAYPGDIFYLHSRLLERAAKLSKKMGGGSLTAIPVIETRAGDISAYIPTNVISITDGQIYLEADLFNAGIRPAINAGISVSRVGGNAQIKAMKKVAGMLRLDLAQYRELEVFAKFGTELDRETKKQLTRGERTIEVLKQVNLSPMAVEDQVLIIYALIKGFLDDVEVKDIRKFENQYLEYIRSSHPGIVKELGDKKEIPEKLEKKINEALIKFREVFFLTDRKISGPDTGKTGSGF
ncbi:MAG: F0F1 ATP synthase subunit alpha [Actinobacteria bacterium]|nr:F0F1 ATP synthase subunit alpha [Actinomycetota bacterium]